MALILDFAQQRALRGSVKRTRMKGKGNYFLNARRPNSSRSEVLRFSKPSAQRFLDVHQEKKPVSLKPAPYTKEELRGEALFLLAQATLMLSEVGEAEFHVALLVEECMNLLDEDETSFREWGIKND